MSGFNIAVEAYIKEHGSISEDVYSALSKLFCEYREEQYGVDTVDSMTAALERKSELNKVKSSFFKKMDEFYSKTMVDEINSQLKKKLKDNTAKINEAMKKGKSKLTEQMNVARNVVESMIDNFIGLSQSAGKKLISIVTGNKFDISTHNSILSLCKSSITRTGKNISDAVKRAAKTVVTVTAKATKLLIHATTTAILASMCLFTILAPNIVTEELGKIPDSARLPASGLLVATAAVANATKEDDDK